MQYTNTIMEKYLRKIWYAEDKAYGVKNITLARAVQACDSVKMGIESRDDRSGRIALKAVNNDFKDIHNFVLL